MTTQICRRFDLPSKIEGGGNSKLIDLLKKLVFKLDRGKIES